MKKIILLIDPPRKIEYADVSRHDMEGYTPLEVELTQRAIEEFTPCTIYTDIKKLMHRKCSTGCPETFIHCFSYSCRAKEIRHRKQ